VVASVAPASLTSFRGSCDIRGSSRNTDNLSSLYEGRELAINGAKSAGEDGGGT
jgi:hypothetical protein